jgi:GH24 family phage-related lysozyme (muramidase)
VNAGRYDDAAEQLLLWDHAGGQECSALKGRRDAENELWRNAQVEQQAAA